VGTWCELRERWQPASGAKRITRVLVVAVWCEIKSFRRGGGLLWVVMRKKLKWIPPARRGNLTALFVVRQRCDVMLNAETASDCSLVCSLAVSLQLQASVVTAGDASQASVYKSRDSAVTSRRCP
jgi:hypothetical protein